MAKARDEAAAALRRSDGSYAAAGEGRPPPSRSAKRKNWRQDSSTDEESRRNASYCSAMYPSLKTLVMGNSDMPEIYAVRWSQPSSQSAGSMSRKTEPLPSTESTSMRPPSSSARLREM